MVSVSVITTAANTASHPPPTYTYTCALSSWSLLAYCANPLLWVDKAMKVVAQAWREEPEVVPQGREE